MARNDTTSAAIDKILKVLLISSAAGSVIIAPIMVQVLEKPLGFFLDKFDEREKAREIKRIILYMRRQGLLIGDYEHGLKITKAGKKRAQQADFNNLSIPKPDKWDKSWRLVIFDIPENYREGRVSLTQKLRLLGFQPLQQSVWIHPFPCREQITTVCLTYNISQYVTYVETAQIDHEHHLEKRFQHIIR